MPYVIFLASFAVYLATATPVITAGDSGELVAAAYTLGIAHPPGYPLYALLGRLFSFIPLGNVAFRLTLMSGVFTALCVLIVYKVAVLVHDGRPSPGAAALALTLGFTGIAWSQAVYCEVYPSQVSLSLAAILFMVRSSREGDFRFVYLSYLFSGLSVSAHYGGALFMPGLCFYALYKMPGRWDFKRAALSVFFFILGLTPFLYLVIRAAQNPAVNWGSPDNFARYMAHLGRSSYGDLSALVIPLSTGGAGLVLVALAGIAAMTGVFLAARRYTGSRERAAAICLAGLTLIYTGYMASKGINADKIRYCLNLVVSGRYWVFLPFAFSGVWFAFRRDRAFLYMCAILLIVIAGISVYRVPSPGEFNFRPLTDKFFLPLLALTAIISAYGVKEALAALPGVWKPVEYSLVLFPAALLFFNYGHMDNSNNFSAYDYSEDIMRTLGRDAVFLPVGDNPEFLTSYMVHVERMRPDVDVFSPKRTEFRPAEEAYGLMADKSRPVYSSEDKVSGIALEPAGLLNRFPSPYDRPEKDPWEYCNIRVEGAAIKEADFQTRQLLAEYYFAWARDLKLKDRGKGEVYAKLDLAAMAGGDLIWANVGIGRIYLSYGEFDRAYMLFMRAIEITPSNPDTYVALGSYYYAKGMYSEAEASLVRATVINGSLPEAFQLLARVRETRGDLKGAADAWRRYITSGEGVDTPFAEANIRRLETSAGNAGKN